MIHNIGAIYEHFRRGAGIDISSGKEKNIYIVGEKWEKEINFVDLLKGRNELIVILNMLEGFDTMQFKLNGVVLPHMVYGIPHNKRQFKIELIYHTEATVISMTHIKHTPSNFGLQYRYYNAANGHIFENYIYKFHLKEKV
jgi:hypothetical protein